MGEISAYCINKSDKEMKGLNFKTTSYSYVVELIYNYNRQSTGSRIPKQKIAEKVTEVRLWVNNLKVTANERSKCQVTSYVNEHEVSANQKADDIIIYNSGSNLHI